MGCIRLFPLTLTSAAVIRDDVGAGRVVPARAFAKSFEIAAVARFRNEGPYKGLRGTVGLVGDTVVASPARLDRVTRCAE